MYSREAATDDIERNPVILIPGLMGSTLVGSDGRTVWGVLGRRGMKPESGDGARAIALPMRLDEPIEALRDDVYPGGVLDRLRVSLFGIPMQVRAYANILRSLGVFAGYRDESLGRSGAIDYGSEHYTCFQFPYDWRLDVAANARRLDEFIREKAAYVEQEDLRHFGRKRESLKFDVVAHSYGSLVLRYYLRYGANDIGAAGSPVPAPTWEGARWIDRAILVAPPNAGSLESLDALLNGRRFGIASYHYSPAILGTFPSLYSNLPRTRHRAVFDEAGAPLDLFDAGIWIERGWGLADASQDAELAKLLPDVPSPRERRRIAIDHLRKGLARAGRIHAALDQKSSPPPGTTIHLAAGDATMTPATATIRNSSTKLSPRALRPGDGTVTRSSALMDERETGEWSRRVQSPIHWASVLFLPGDHLGMTSDPTFTDNVLYTLLEAR
jgi:hypothetical protein